MTAPEERFLVPKVETAEAGSSSESPPLSPKSDRYRLKTSLLQTKAHEILLLSYCLRNRIYHVKKEISHLNRLKRILCHRLHTYQDMFLENPLEIPDSDPSTTILERVLNDNIGKPAAVKKKKTAGAKRAAQFSTEDELAKKKVRSLVESVALSSRESQRRTAGSSGSDSVQNSAAATPSYIGTPGLPHSLSNSSSVESADKVSLTSSALRISASEKSPDTGHTNRSQSAGAENVGGAPLEGNFFMEVP